MPIPVAREARFESARAPAHPHVGASKEVRIAGLLLSLLLNGDPELGEIEESDWDPLQRIAARNSVLLRAADRLHEAGIKLPERVAESVQQEQERVRAMLGTLPRLADVCRRARVPFIFARSFQHLPDMGRDIDLLVVSRSSDVNQLLRRELGAVPLSRGFHGWVAGSSQFRVPGCPATLDIQYGRLGLLGEHTEFPSVLLRRSRPLTVGAGTFRVPREEDQLVLQAVQRVYGRTSIRLADVAATVKWVWRGALDWDEVIQTTRDLGVLAGLSCYLSYVNQIHESHGGRPLPWAPAIRQLLRPDWGKVQFGEYGYRFPVLAVNSRLYAERLATELTSHHWADAARLSLVPLLAAATLLEHTARQLGLRLGAEDPSQWH